MVILRNLAGYLVTQCLEMVEMVEKLDGRLGKRSVERVRYVINNLLHIVKYGVISLVLCISTRLRLVTILSLLVKYLVILHADPCNKSYIYMDTSPDHITPCSRMRVRVRGNEIQFFNDIKIIGKQQELKDYLHFIIAPQLKKKHSSYSLSKSD